MNKTWVLREEEKLKEFYPKKSVKFLEKFFLRKMTAIRTKAGRMGIKRDVKINLNKTNGMWKGDKVGYTSLHEWVARHKKKPKLCEECKKNKPYDLANISGNYKRDIRDFQWLCRKCHMAKDGRLKNFVNSRRNKKW